MNEIQVINTALLKKECLFHLMQYDRDIFTDFKSQICHDVLNDLFSQGMNVDLPLLITELKDRELYSKIGGDNFLSLIMKENAIVDFQAVLNKFEKRYLHTKMSLISTDYFQKKIDLDQFVNKASDLIHKTENESHCIDIEKLIDIDLDELYSIDDRLKTGIGVIDEKIDGISNGSTMIIAARPGIGKTTLALQIAKEIRGNVLFFSLEMKRKDILAKLISQIADVTVSEIKGKRLNEEQMTRVLKNIDTIKNTNITVFDNSDNFSMMMNQIRNYVKMKNSKAVVIDYIQLITGGQGENQNLRISYISRMIKKLAMQLNIPIIVLSQLNREVEKTTREPHLSDLRDSGSLEQDSSQVLFLHEDSSGNTSLIVAKNREGRCGKINGLIFNKEFSRFDEININQKNVNYKTEYFHD